MRFFNSINLPSGGKKITRPTIFIIALLLFLFAAWFAVSLGFADRVNQFKDDFGVSTIFHAQIVSDPVASSKYSQKFEILPQGFTEKILVSASSRGDYQYGDQIYIRGKPKMPAEFDPHFDYVRYLQSENIYAQMTGTEVYVLSHAVRNPVIFYGLKIKHVFYAQMQKYLPAQSAALLIALLVGDKALMSPDIVAEFSRVGVAHLIAVSSYVLTVTLILAARLKPRLGIFLTVLLCSAVILLNLIMANFSAGMLRAAIMFGLYFLSKILGRQYSVIPVLLLTAALLVAANPLIIKYDIGFMLSFGSILGIILFAPLLTKFFAKFPRAIPEKFGIRDVLAATIAAQFASIPLTIYYFQQLPLVSPLANLVIDPIVTPVTLGGYFLAVPVIAKLAAAALLIPLQYILAAVHFLASFKYAAVQANISSFIFVLLYALELVVYFLVKYLSR